MQTIGGSVSRIRALLRAGSVAQSNAMKTRTLAVALALLSALSLVGVIGAVPMLGGGGTLTELWVSDTSRDAVGNHHTPAVAQIDDETVIVAPVNAPEKVGSCALVTFTTSIEEQWQATVPTEACNIHAFGDPTVADLDGDGDREVLVATTEKLVHAYDLQTGREEFSRGISGWGYAAPVVSNFTPSEGRELIVAGLTGGVSVFDSTGALLWSQNVESIVAPIFVEDVDADGTDELAVGEGGNVTILESDGTVARQTPVGSSVTWLTSGQGDGDEAVELVAATLDGRIVAVDGRTGEIEWERQYDKLAAVYAFGDGDGDGQAEVYAVAQDGKLRALDASDGSGEWTTTLTNEDVQMTPPPSLGDLDGDGDRELVAVSQDGVVSVVNPNSGSIVDSYERDVPIWMRPTLADLDSDAGLEIMVTYGDGRVVALSFSPE